MCSNAYDDVKDFEVCEFIKNTDLNSFRSRVFLKVVFSTNKKTIHYPFRALSITLSLTFVELLHILLLI